MTEEVGKTLRHEFKYEISQLQYHVLKKRVALLFKPDPFTGPTGGYHVRNLYFDDFRNTSLFEKWAGIYTRKKYRIRIYDLRDDKIKFERKTKYGEYILKETARLTRHEADMVIAGDFSLLAKSKEPLLREAYIESQTNLLQAVVIVDYYREAFYDPVSHVRITFDTNLRAGLGSVSMFDPDVPAMRVLNEPNIIMEIKFGHVFPHYIQGLFPPSMGLRLAIGKFALCRAQQTCLFGAAIGGLPYARTHKIVHGNGAIG